MKKMYVSILAGLLATPGLSTARAVDLQFDYLLLEADLGDAEDFEPKAIQVKLINSIGPNSDFIGVFALGTSDDELEEFDPFFGTVRLSVDLSTLLGVYGRIHTGLGEGPQFFGQVGLVRLDYDLDAEIFGLSGSESYDDIGLAFGVGLSVGVSDQSAFVIEYNQYPDVDIEDVADIETSALSLGFRTSF